MTLTVLTDPPEAAVFVEGEPRGTSNGEGRLVLERLRLGRGVGGLDGHGVIIRMKDEG